jgi:hypothetical protein
MRIMADDDDRRLRTGCRSDEVQGEGAPNPRPGGVQMVAGSVFTSTIISKVTRAPVPP